MLVMATAPLKGRWDTYANAPLEARAWEERGIIGVAGGSVRCLGTLRFDDKWQINYYNDFLRGTQGKFISVGFREDMVRHVLGEKCVESIPCIPDTRASVMRFCRFAETFESSCRDHLQVLDVVCSLAP